MKKIILILRREYEMRVMSKAFLMLCLLLPILLTAMVMSTVINTKAPQREKSNHRSEITFVVIDDAGLLPTDTLEAVGNISFELQKDKPVGTVIGELKDTGYRGVIYLSEVNTQPAVKVSTYGILSQNIERAIKLNFQNYLSPENKNTQSDPMIIVYEQLEEVRQKSPIEIRTVLGISLGSIVYFFIFFYGVRTLNAVVEEKINRMSEIIISSARAQELMFGKIFGITLAVFTQVIIVALATLFLSKLAVDSFGTEQLIQQSTEGVGAAMTGPLFSTFDILMLVISFTIYFVMGFMLYAAIFAAIGAAMEPNEDTLQFVFPVLIPLIFALILVITSAMSNPENSVMFWASMFPLTSPVVMSYRLAAGVVWWEVTISVVLLIGGFVFVTFLAGRIYRVGILLYGTKPSIKMIGKWLLAKE